jgi:hypothetical protein
MWWGWDEEENTTNTKINTNISIGGSYEQAIGSWEREKRTGEGGIPRTAPADRVQLGV